jgi:iron complex transport system ATP-binding protein
VIEVRGLCLKRSSRPVLEGYSFSVAKGDVLAVLGANGVGKTTLLGCLTGILTPDAGQVAVSRRVGFVPQLFSVAFDYTVTDVVLMGRARQIGLFGAPAAQDYRKVGETLDLLGIGALAERPFNALSGGQRQLAVIAQALVSDCEILILDEPCSSLDYRNQAVVVAIMGRLAADLGMTVVFSSHAPEHALEIASHALLMEDSRRYRHGVVAEVLTPEHLSELYGLPIGRARFAGSERHTFAPIYGALAAPGAAAGAATGTEP